MSYERANVDTDIAVSDTSTTTYDSGDQTNAFARGVIVTVDVTALTGTSYTISIQAKDPLSGKYYIVAADSAQTATATRTLVVYPGAGTAANGISVSASFPLPRTWKVHIAKSAVSAFTATIGASYIL